MGALSESRIGRFAAQRFVNVFRVIPELALIFWMYFCLPPLLGLRLSPGFCGVLALSLTSAAYLAEVFRAGVLAAPRGLVEAAMALGLRPYRPLAPHHPAAGGARDDARLRQHLRRSVEAHVTSGRHRCRMPTGAPSRFSSTFDANSVTPAWRTYNTR